MKFNGYLDLKEKKFIKYIIILLSLLLLVSGLWTGRYHWSIAAIIVSIAALIESINPLYSIFMILFFFSNSKIIDMLSFRWERLYFFLFIIILIKILFARFKLKDISSLIKDKYLLLMVLILFWGSLASFNSIERVLSFKKTISVFLAFIIFFLLPKYYLKKEEKASILAFLMYPLNLLMTILSLANILFSISVLEITRYIPFWTVKETIYKNSNFLGYYIMMVILLMNVYILDNRGDKKKLKDSILLKLYIFVSYLILFGCLVLSGSRTSMLAIGIAFIPFVFIYFKVSLVGGIPMGYLLWKNRDKLYLLSKFQYGTTGRTELWDYVAKEVIPKYPLLGVGSGAYMAYMEQFYGKSAHNAYLHEIMINGFPSLVLWFGILFFIFKSILKLKEGKYLYLFTILSFLFYSIFEIGLFGEISLRMAIFWIFAMLIESPNNEEFLYE